MTETADRITPKRAALLHNALDLAYHAVADQMSFKRATPYRAAMALQMAEFKLEQERLAATFPELITPVKGDAKPNT